MDKMSKKMQAMISGGSDHFHRVKPGQRVSLNKIDPQEIAVKGVDKETAAAMIPGLQAELVALQELLYAQHKHKVLVVLQAMDTAGKDGVIRHVFRGVNPQGVRVAAFKTPTPIESDHDYLWRIHQQVPARGEMVIFNRSHYEDVLFPRVHGLVDRAVCRRRFDQINDFESMLADEGAVILKFFLHIDKEEQKRRLEERLRDPAKNWKFSPADLKERALWPRYMEAYADALSHTSTAQAPWYVIPANRKWYRDLVISLILIDRLKALGMTYPRQSERLKM
jgi:PPK2 family polyphosphate:nucleotide phosphotransferase